MSRRSISTGTEWEARVGYSRAIRVGSVIEVAGTVAMEEGQVISPGDPFIQTKHILKKIENFIGQLGGNLSDIVRTRIYVVDINMWDEIGRAHGEVLGDARPVTSMVEVSSLIAPEYLVEIEATAIVERRNRS